MLFDQLGGIHLERPGELSKPGHGRLDLVALDPGYGWRGDAGVAFDLPTYRAVVSAADGKICRCYMGLFSDNRSAPPF